MTGLQHFVIPGGGDSLLWISRDDGCFYSCVFVRLYKYAFVQKCPSGIAPAPTRWRGWCSKARILRSLILLLSSCPSCPSFNLLGRRACDVFFIDFLHSEQNCCCNLARVQITAQQHNFTSPVSWVTMVSALTLALRKNLFREAIALLHELHSCPLPTTTPSGRASNQCITGHFFEHMFHCTTPGANSFCKVQITCA